MWRVREREEGKKKGEEGEKGMYLRLGMRYEAEICTIVISMNRAFK